MFSSPTNEAPSHCFLADLPLLQSEWGWNSANKREELEEPIAWWVEEVEVEVEVERWRWRWRWRGGEVERWRE